MKTSLDNSIANNNSDEISTNQNTNQFIQDSSNRISKTEKICMWVGGVLSVVAFTGAIVLSILW